MPVDEIVRPLERHVLEAFRFEGAHDGDPDGERQTGEKARPLLELPAKGKREASAGDGRPRAPAAAAARRLPFGGEGHSMDVAALRAAHELRGRRLDLVDHFDRRGKGRPLGGEPVGEVRTDLLGVQELGRFEQPVAPALDLLQSEARGPGIL
jgi:hypothetical protein